MTQLKRLYTTCSHGLWLTLFFVLSNLYVYAQQPSSSDLKRKQAEIQKEIDALRKSLDQTQKYKKQSLGQLALIQKKLRLREQQIANINQQVNAIQGDINKNWREIVKLRAELDTLTQQYEKSVVYAYMNRSNYDFLNFIFSADNFNDAIKRVSYLKSYRAYREEQAANIRSTQALLQGKIQGLNQNKAEKSKVLEEENKQRQVLAEEKKEKDAVVSKLKSQEKELNKSMAAKRKQDASLRAAISAAIRREIEAENKRMAAAKAAEDKKNAALKAEASKNGTTVPVGPVKAPERKATGSSSVFDNRPEIKAVSDNFEKNKGNLPWPVSQGTVSMRFGRQNYFERVDYDNPGITIETAAGSSVKSVFDGEVTAIVNVGGVQGVIIKHGKYFTTYSNLESVSVTKGQAVKMGQVLGRVSEKEEGRGELEFLISNDKYQNYDPEKWLR
jgi:septal ring factor EnvC (AmiA/AmiB activator)